MSKKELLAMLLAGGQGSRLYDLTKDVAKPAVSFGAKYRIIDFPLSNCANSGINHVGVYIGGGQVIHARYSVGKVYINSLSESYYATNYVGAVRIA